METSTPARCQRHPESPAGWTCHGCQAALCPECAITKRAQTAEFFVCLLCGGTATPLLVHRRATPFLLRALRAWRYPFETTNLLFLVGASLLMAFFRWMTDVSPPVTKLPPAAIGSAVFWTALFAIIRSTAQGKREVEPPDFTSAWADFLGPALRGFVALSGVWLPGVLYVLFVRERGAGSLWEDPFLWGLVVVGVLCVPMLLLSAATETSVLRMLNPVALIGRIRHLGRDYLLTVGLLLGLLVPHALAHLVGAGLRYLDIFLISRTLAECLTSVVPFIMANVLGLLLYTRGDDLDYGLARDYLEPVLGDVTPRVQPEAFREPEAPHAQPVPEPPPVASGELASLAKAIEARDVAGALGLYPALHALVEARKAMDPAHHLFVGQAAASQGDYPLAVQALEAAADVAPDSPTAPRALVLLARVYGERLQETERAEGIYRYIVHRYPDTDASRFARQRIPGEVPES